MDGKPSYIDIRSGSIEFDANGVVTIHVSELGGYFLTMTVTPERFLCVTDSNHRDEYGAPKSYKYGAEELHKALNFHKPLPRGVVSETRVPRNVPGTE